MLSAVDWRPSPVSHIQCSASCTAQWRLVWCNASWGPLVSTKTCNGPVQPQVTWERIPVKQKLKVVVSVVIEHTSVFQRVFVLEVRELW